MKKRILWVSDSARISSGFGRVVREVAGRLHALGKYEIAQHGWFDHFATHPVPFPIFPTRKDGSGQPLVADKYGLLSFDDVCVKFRPDLVIGVGDPPFLQSIRRSNLRSLWRSIFYSPIDGFPLTPSWKDVLQVANRLILFGDWPKRLVEKEFGISCHNTISHGVDTKIFHPPNPAERRKARLTRLGEDDTFTFGFVGRNSERKRVDLVIQAISLLHHGHYGRCSNCQKTFVDPLNNMGERTPRLSCPFCTSDLLRATPRKVNLILHTCLEENPICSVPVMTKSYGLGTSGVVRADPTYTVARGYPDTELVKHYWAMDAYVSFATEGFGFPILEAMACGLPIITGNYSMPPEYCSRASLLVEAESWGNDLYSGLLRPVPDIGQFIDYALLLMGNPDLRKTLGAAGWEDAQRLDWSHIAKLWEKEIDSILVGAEARPIEI